MSSQASNGHAPHTQYGSSDAPPFPQRDLGLRKPNMTPLRLPRSNHACEVCHQRKVRCDVSARGAPCTNCAAFSLECRIRQHKQRPNADGTVDIQTDNQYGLPHGLDDDNLSSDSQGSASGLQSTYDALHMATISSLQHDTEAMEITNRNHPSTASATGTTQEVSTMHPFFEQNIDLEELELSFLHQRGAFLLPPRILCDELIEAYFHWVAPIVPCVNETEFRAKYSRNDNSVSILLLQAVLLAGSKVCTSSELNDDKGSTYPASSIFYRRAKALYDAHYEDDVNTIVQALTLMSWSEEGPDDITKNVFYWSSLAITVAQDTGLHRSVEDEDVSNTLTDVQKRARKRIWWTLFSRDRSIARSIGRPVQINADEISLEMITEDDFVEEGSRPWTDKDHERVQFFLAYTQLSYVTGLVLSEDYVAKTRPDKAFGYAYLDLKLADWLQECPQTLMWKPETHSFLSALLLANYWTTVCLLQRRQVEIEENPTKGHGSVGRANILAANAAGKIVDILSVLQARGELRRVPSFTIYIAFSALAVLGPELRSNRPERAASAQRSVDVCMNALKDMSVAWLTAKMVHSFFTTTLLKQRPGSS